MISRRCPVCNCRVWTVDNTYDYTWFTITCDECGYTEQYDAC
ncbi:hypothetical protein [Candidatus Methanomassiliicoccus intestinalis]